MVGRLGIEATTKRLRAPGLYALLAIALVIADCGGGGGGGAAPASSPATASSPAPADDTQALQAMLDAGGTVHFEASTYHFSRTLTVSQSNTVIVGQGAATVLEFTPGAGKLQQCVTDRAITTPCDFDAKYLPHQVGAPIAVGDTSFQIEQASDLTDIAPGDWLLVNDYDELVGDRVAVDWVRVASVDGTTVNVTTPFRMAFTTARPWVAGKSGLGFEPIKPLVQGVEFRNLTVKVDPTTTANVWALCIFGALDTRIDSVTVTDPIGQPFYSYLSKGYSLTNSQAFGGAVISELAATVDMAVSGNHFSSEAPGIGVDLGAGFFTVENNTVSQSANAGMYFLYGVHDGTVSNNQIEEVSVTTDTNATGLLLLGSQNIAVTGNNLAGGAGPASVGIDIGDFDGGALPELDTGVTVGGNTVAGFVTAVEQQ